MAFESPVECVADVRALLGESPVWVKAEAALYWVDIKGRAIFRLGDGDLRQWPTPFRVGSIAPKTSGGFIAGTDHGIAEIEPESGRFDIVCNPEAHLPGNRFNDGKVDRSGNFWAGTMDDAEESAAGSLYRVSPTLEAAIADTGFKVTNGPAFSPDGSIMYHNDSARQLTFAYDLDPEGKAGNRRVFLKFGDGDGYPDGMTVDCEGGLWIAFWDGGCVRRFSPQGELVRTIELPVSRPTSCAFGGKALDRLYVTSARIGLDDDALAMQPNAGGVFMVIPGMRGLADIPFAG